MADADDVAAGTATGPGPTPSVPIVETPPSAPEHETTGPADAEGPSAEGDTPGTEWSPPKLEPETGIALDGHGLPINHRLRAERLADSGKDEDPAGEISPEHIADAKGRLAAQAKADAARAKAEEAANPPVHAHMKTADLERIAKKQGIELSSATNNEERVALIEAARASGAARPANEEKA